MKRDELGPSGKDTRTASKAIKSKLRQARHLATDMAQYQVLGTSQQPEDVRVTEEQLLAILRDEPAPWAGESASTPLGKLLHYGRLYYQLLSDRDRCKEQLTLLGLEHLRLQAWLRHMIGVCELACAQLSGHTAGHASYVNQHCKKFITMLPKAQCLRLGHS